MSRSAAVRLIQQPYVSSSSRMSHCLQQPSCSKIRGAARPVHFAGRYQAFSDRRIVGRTESRGPERLVIGVPSFPQADYRALHDLPFVGRSVVGQTRALRGPDTERTATISSRDGAITHAFEWAGYRAHGVVLVQPVTAASDRFTFMPVGRVLCCAHRMGSRPSGWRAGTSVPVGKAQCRDGSSPRWFRAGNHPRESSIQHAASIFIGSALCRAGPPSREFRERHVRPCLVDEVSRGFVAPWILSVSRPSVSGWHGIEWPVAPLVLSVLRPSL